MDLTDKLRPGMRLLGPDGDDYGGIDGYDSQTVYLADQRIPHSAIERIDGNDLYLKAFSAAPNERYEATAVEAMPMDESITERLPVSQVTDSAVHGREVLDADDVLEGGSGEIRVPLIEERLKVDIRQVDLGEIDVHKTVESVEETWFEPVDHEEVQIERVKVTRNIDAPEQPRQEGEWLVVPVIEEMIVVRKQLVVVEEIRIRKHRVTEQQEVRETVRREHVVVEDRTRPLSQSHTAGSARTDDDAGWDDLQQQVRNSDR